MSKEEMVKYYKEQNEGYLETIKYHKETLSIYRKNCKLALKKGTEEVENIKEFYRDLIEYTKTSIKYLEHFIKENEVKISKLQEE